MKAIILAAGEGTRLRPHTLDRPKCLVQVAGRSLLEAQLGVLRHGGIEDIVIIRGYLEHALGGIAARFYSNPEYATTNMVWTLFKARAELTGAVLISYGDIVYSPTVLDAVAADPRPIAVAVDKDWLAYWQARCTDPLDDAETLKLDAAGRIVEVGQPPRGLEDIQGQYIGLMKFQGAGLRALIETFDAAVARGDLGGRPPERAYMTDMLQALIARGHDVWPVPIHGEWIEVDTIADLELPITRERMTQIRAYVEARG